MEKNIILSRSQKVKNKGVGFIKIIDKFLSLSLLEAFRKIADYEKKAKYSHQLPTNVPNVF